MPTLNWIGKEAVINHHLEVPFRLLKDVPELASGDPGSGNLIVEGDNLVALKALLPYYKGKVKCICIDPPYNTGNEGWAYNDNVNSPAIRKWLGETVGKEGETLDRHDRWLCMMYPRLALLREFLSEEGSIFITLDDNEIHALRYVMDEVFGSNNFVECVTWNKRIPKNDAGIGNIHEYIMIYRKSASWDFRFTMKKEGLEKVDELIEKFQKHEPPIKEAEDSLKKLYKDGGYDRGVTLYNCLDEKYRPWGKINMSWPNANTFGPRYEVLHPKTGKAVKIPDRGWRWKEETFKAHMAKGPRYERYDGSIVVGRIWFAKDENTQPSSITYLDEVNRILLRSVLSLKSDGGMEVEEFFGSKSKFAYPKPTSLIQTLVDSIEMEDGDIVLDSFAGSGTTGEVVMRLNKRDQLNRRFILVELSSKVAQDITRERVRRVAEGYTNAKGEKVEGLGGEFRYVRLGDELFDAHGRINESAVRFADLARHVYFSETGEPLPKERISAKSPLLGIHNGRAVYLLYNGILGDKKVKGGNVLCRETLAIIQKHNAEQEGIEQTVVYGTSQRLALARLKREGIVFKQIPYNIRIS